MRVGERLEVAVEANGEPLGRADRLLLEDLGPELGELCPDAIDRLLGLLSLPDEEAQPQLALPVRLVVEGEPGRVGPSVLAAVEHRDQVAAERRSSSAVSL